MSTLTLQRPYNVYSNLLKKRTRLVVSSPSQTTVIHIPRQKCSESPNTIIISLTRCQIAKKKYRKDRRYLTSAIAQNVSIVIICERRQRRKILTVTSASDGLGSSAQIANTSSIHVNTSHNVSFQETSTPFHRPKGQLRQRTGAEPCI